MRMSETVKTGVDEVQWGLHSYIGRGTICIPNVSYGFFSHIECDLIEITESGCIHEYEIKRSWSDFLADFKKPHFHDDIRICRLTFVLPKEFADERLVAFCRDNYAAFRREFDFLFYENDGRIVQKERQLVATKWGGSGYSLVFPEAYRSERFITDEMLNTIRDNDRDRMYRRHLFLEEKVKLYRLALIKAWDKRI